MSPLLRLFTFFIPLIRRKGTLFSPVYLSSCDAVPSLRTPVESPVRLLTHPPPALKGWVATKRPEPLQLGRSRTPFKNTRGARATLKWSYNVTRTLKKSFLRFWGGVSILGTQINKTTLNLSLPPFPIELRKVFTGKGPGKSADG